MSPQPALCSTSPLQCFTSEPLRKRRRSRAPLPCECLASDGAWHTCMAMEAWRWSSPSCVADDVSGVDAFGNNLFQRLIDKDRVAGDPRCGGCKDEQPSDRKSTRLNSSHLGIS